MKIKISMLLALAIATLTMLISCQIPGMGSGTGGNQNEQNEYNRIVYADDSLDLIAVRDALGDIVGKIISVAPDTEAAADGEIVFGETNRPVTAAAKAALEKELAKSGGYDAGYIFYCDGKNIAVYWTLDEMELLAIPKFVEECLSGSEVTGEKGVIFTEFYKKDEFERDKAWALIEANATADVVAALKELYGFYDGTKLAGYLANLYDPEIGGFYYSISARDSAGFLPDMESTSQLLSTMVNNGAFKDRSTALPEDIKARIISFIKGNQSPTDGYFYHPQWPQDKDLLQTDRYGRDQGWATGLLDDITLDTDGDGVQEKQYPNYCNTMKGVKCEKHDGTDDRCIFPISEAQQLTSAAASDTEGLTDVIGVSVSSAVSKVHEGVSSVIAAATVSSHPDYSSREAFKTWLYQYNDPEKIKESSGRAHNLSAIKDEIAAHGMLDILLDQLDEVQAEVFDEMLAAGETPTGLWQRNVDYNAVWGLLKYINIYNSGKREIKVKYLSYIVETCIKVIQLPPSDDYHMNDMYNQWAGIDNLIDNVKKYNPGSEQIIYDIIRANSAPLISNSLAKIESFKLSDGSFSANYGGYSAAKIYGVPISLGVQEGNVNAIGLCCGMYRVIFSCLGYKHVPIFTEADGKMFIETLKNVEPIVKAKLEVGSNDFEDDSLGSITVDTGNTNAAAAVIVEDPTDPSNNALYFTSPPASSGGSGTITFNPKDLGGNCYIFESRMYFESTDSHNYVMQLRFVKDLYMITMHRSGNNIEIREASTSSGGATYNKVATVPMKEWFTLRVEYYAPDESTEDGLPRIKIWVNEELVVSNSTFYYNHHIGAEPGTKFTSVTLRSMNQAGTYVYLDDCYCSKENKSFDPNDEAISDARDNAD